MALAAGTRLGGYEILSPLGAGGMGEVYRARDAKLNRDVAIKILPAALAADPDAQARFQREAQAVAALSHPNILGIFDFGVDGGTPYAVTELLEGGTLHERIAEGALPPRKGIECAVQIATGLAAAHERDITHRDLKPENVFLTRDGRVKILDFGLAKIGAGPTPAVGASMEVTFHVTSPGTVLGTVGYMSPEQVRGRAVDHRSDIFSLGAVLFEMVAGERAFTGESAVETMNAILKEDPPELTRAHAALPPALDRIVRRCLEKNPDERFQSARDLAFALDAISGSSTKADISATGEPPARSPRMVLAGSAVALVAVAFALGWFARSGGRSAADGDAAQPTFHRLTFRRGFVSGARFAPDGQTVVYSAQWQDEPPALYTTGRASPESRPFGLKGQLLGISTGGVMAVLTNPHSWLAQYQQNGMLAEMPLTGGAPREVQDDVRYADWAPDGHELAVVRQVGRTWRLEYPLGHTLYESAFELVGPRVSPKGELIAFFEAGQFGTTSVAVFDRQGKRRITSQGYSDWWYLAWRPDGQEIWFAASESGRANPLWAIDLAGRRRVLIRLPGINELHDVSRDGRALVSKVDMRISMTALGPDQARERDLTWHDYSNVADVSDDGRLMVFQESGDAGGKRGITYLRKTDGSAAVPLGEGMFGSLSPDGKLVASVGVPNEVFLLPTGPGQARKLTYERFASISKVAWFRDGHSLLIAATEPTHSVRLYAQSIEGGDVRAVSPEGFDISQGGRAISPDGKFVVAMDPDGTVFLVTMDGAAPRRAAGVERGEVPVGWSSDGRSVYVFRHAELPAKVVRVDIGAGKRTPWKELTPSDPTGVMGLTQLVMTPDGRSYAYSCIRLLSDLYLVEGVK